MSFGLLVATSDPTASQNHMGSTLLLNRRCCPSCPSVFLGHCVGTPLLRRHRFGIWWEGWSTNAAAAVTSQFVMLCKQRGRVLLLLGYICGVGGWLQTRLARGGRLSEYFTAIVTTIYGIPEKKHCSGQAAYQKSLSWIFFPNCFSMSGSFL